MARPIIQNYVQHNHGCNVMQGPVDPMAQTLRSRRPYLSQLGAKPAPRAITKPAKKNHRRNKNGRQKNRRKNRAKRYLEKEEKKDAEEEEDEGTAAEQTEDESSEMVQMGNLGNYPIYKPGKILGEVEEDEDNEMAMTRFEGEGSEHNGVEEDNEHKE